MSNWSTMTRRGFLQAAAGVGVGTFFFGCTQTEPPPPTAPPETPAGQGTDTPSEEPAGPDAATPSPQDVTSDIESDAVDLDKLDEPLLPGGAAESTDHS